MPWTPNGGPLDLRSPTPRAGRGAGTPVCSSAACSPHSSPVFLGDIRVHKPGHVPTGPRTLSLRAGELPGVGSPPPGAPAVLAEAGGGCAGVRTWGLGDQKRGAGSWGRCGGPARAEGTREQTQRSGAFLPRAAEREAPGLCARVCARARACVRELWWCMFACLCCVSGCECLRGVQERRQRTWDGVEAVGCGAGVVPL